MSVVLTYFEPTPAPTEVPAQMPSPFAVEPHPLARRAAEDVRRTVTFALADDGKMLGVLVVADASGRIGYLRAFSGMVEGSWNHPGFAPPVFDAAERDGFWLDGERELAAIAARIAAAEPLRAARAELTAQHVAQLEALRALHRARRAARHEARAAGAPREPLDRESRADRTERRRIDEMQRTAREALPVEDGLERERADLSRELLRRIWATYRFASAAGAERSLCELFAPAEPPGGAGDCAAPKLLALAYRMQLRPLALAEVWCGAPPVTGGRRDGSFYPACRGKCGPILAHMLAGLEVEPAPVFGTCEIAADEPRTIFEDRWLVIVAKPSGLLSVPGRSGELRDSALVRLRARYPGAALVHRLDLDASGLLLCAKDDATHAALQRLFARCEIDKRYSAWLDGDVSRDRGVVELPLRVDLDDRPRQIVDPVHGKPAKTEWRVVSREGARTRVELQPRTGRTHQLRVHASHPSGIGAAIVGDRLYGRPAERLLLHAAQMSFIHPHTGVRVSVEDAPPF